MGDGYFYSEADRTKQRRINDTVDGLSKGAPFHENEGRLTPRVPPHRFVQITEEVTAAAYTDGSPTALGKGKGRFRRARSDGSSIGNAEEEPVRILSLDESVNEVGKTVLVYRCQDLKGDNGPEPGWIIPKPASSFNLPSIKLGMGAAAQTENVFSTPSATYDIAWSDENLITDTSVFDVNDPGDPFHHRIVCKVAGIYRVWCHVRFEAESTNTASEIQRGTIDICKTNSVGGASVIVPSATDRIESLHINGADYPTTLGALNGRGDCESRYQMAANECFKVQFSYASGTRGMKAWGESFGAELIKRL